MGKLVDKIKNGKLMKWVGDNAPNALDLVGDITGIGALNRVADLIDKNKELTPEQKAQFKEIYELELKELDLYLKDVDSAREREVEMAKTGKTDWLMYASGVTALLAFILVVVSAIFIKSTQENPLFHQLMGIIEGVALTIFAYYFGTSKSSSDKTKLLGPK